MAQSIIKEYCRDWVTATGLWSELKWNMPLVSQHLGGVLIGKWKASEKGCVSEPKECGREEKREEERVTH